MLKEMTLEYVESLKYVDEIPRRFALPEAGSDIVAVVGPRRVGKTFTLLKKAAETLKAGGQAVYATFDNPELRKWSAKKLAEEVRSLYPTGRVALFLDEVQEWPNWDYNLRWLHDVKDFQIYATGSTSALSVDQVPSRLRGRYISKLLPPSWPTARRPTPFARGGPSRAYSTTTSNGAASPRCNALGQVLASSSYRNARDSSGIYSCLAEQQICLPWS